MITITAANAAIQIAEEFDRRGIAVVPKSGSTVEKLTALSSCPTSLAIQINNELNSAGDEYTPEAEGLVLESQAAGGDITHEDGEVTTIDGHCAELETEVVETVEAVNAHFDFARNHVKPLVRSLAEKIQSYLTAYPETASFNPEVVRYDLPEPALNSTFSSYLEPYKNLDFVPVDVTECINGIYRSGEEIIELIKTGSKVLDGDIDVWAARMTPSFFEKVYNSIYGAGRTDKTTEKPIAFDALVSDRATGADAALVVFLAGKKLLDTAPDEGVGIDLTTFRARVGNFINQSGLRINAALDQRDRDYKQRLMIRSYNRNQIVVFSPVYDEWLEEGNNVAALFGNILSDRPAVLANVISNNAPASIALWERQNRILTAALKTNRSTGIRSAIKISSDEVLRENLKECFSEYVTDEELTMSQPKVVDAIQKIRDYVDNLKDDEVDDVWKIATHIVADKIFYYTDSLRILQAINQAFEDNPEITIDEAVFLARICYVTDCCCDQLELRPLNK